MNRCDEEMDDSAMWREIRRAGQEKRAGNREGSMALLTANGVYFESRNYGAHLIVKHAGKEVDLWPGTGRWIDRNDRKVDRRGVFKLLQYLGVSLGGVVSVDEENQLLCEKLLGWEPSDIHAGFWHTSTDEVVQGTPTFLTGDGMLLLLEAMCNVHLSSQPNAKIHRLTIDWDTETHASIPAAVRSCALEYILAQP